MGTARPLYYDCMRGFLQKLTQKMRGKSPKNDAKFCATKLQKWHKMREQPPKYDADSHDFGDKNLYFTWGYPQNSVQLK